MECIQVAFVGERHVEAHQHPKDLEVRPPSSMYTYTAGYIRIQTYSIRIPLGVYVYRRIHPAVYMYTEALSQVVVLVAGAIPSPLEVRPPSSIRILLDI